MLRRGLILCLVVLWLAAQGYAATVAPEFPDPGRTSMSRENQRALGLKTAAEVYKQMPVLPDSSPETQFVRQIGQKLVATIPTQYSWPFEFHVVAQKEINAFALPGGTMFINIGTITASDNEAELAGVMAHEMSHVYMQHSAKQAGKAETTSLLAGIAGAVLGGTVGGVAGELGEMGIQMGEKGLILKYSRGDESQADAVGAIILYKAGYNPQALADFFKKLESEGGSAPPQLLSDHPNPGNREEKIQKEIKDWPPKDFAGDSPAFQTARQHARGVKAYTAQEIAKGAKSGEWAVLNKSNGAIFNPTSTNTLKTSAFANPGEPSTVAATSLQNVLPGGNMVATDLGHVKISCPDTWQVTVPHKQGHFVTIAPSAGITDKGVGYGVLLNGVAPRKGGRIDIDEITAEIVKDMQRDNGLEPVRSAQPITVGGAEGRSAVFQSRSPFPSADGQSQLEHDWLVTVPARDGGVIFMIFVAPESDFARFQSTYDAMLKSVQLN
jgi:beta-barrel assembly-enhancing protease